MPTRALRPALIVSVWTLLVWTTRLRNIWSDDELSTPDQVWRTALALAFTVGALAVLASIFRAPQRAASVVRFFAIFTVGAWIIRGGQILLGDWAGAFKAVHSVLAIGSIALVWWADRSVRAGSPVHTPVTASSID